MRWVLRARANRRKLHGIPWLTTLRTSECKKATSAQRFMPLGAPAQSAMSNRSWMVGACPEVIGFPKRAEAMAHAKPQEELCYESRRFQRCGTAALDRNCARSNSRPDRDDNQNRALRNLRHRYFDERRTRRSSARSDSWT